MVRALLGGVALALAAWSQPPSGPPDQFLTVNGVRLHYLDWGGSGPTLLFLTSFGASAREYDHLAPQFTSRFRVLGLTRRGQPPSAAPESGYETRALVDDTRGFLDALRIDRVALAGYSIAGTELTLFAAVYPDRVTHLVYLDALGDNKSAYELATNPVTRYPLPLPEPDGALGRIARGARAADPDYTKVQAPALAFCVISTKPFVPPDADDASKARLVERYEKYGRAFQQRQRDHFRRDLRHGRIVELHDTTHGTFLRDPAPQAIVVREMLAFLSAPRPATPGR